MDPLTAEAALVAREMITKLVGLARTRGDMPKLAMALHTHGHACLLAGETDEAEKAFDESREVSERLGDARSTALSAGMLGFVAITRGKLEEGVASVVASAAKLDAADKARAAVFARLATHSKKLDRARFDAALAVATRPLPDELKAEVAQAIAAARG